MLCKENTNFVMPSIFTLQVKPNPKYVLHRHRGFRRSTKELIPILIGPCDASGLSPQFSPSSIISSPSPCPPSTRRGLVVSCLSNLIRSRSAAWGWWCTHTLKIRDVFYHNMIDSSRQSTKREDRLVIFAWRDDAPLPLDTITAGLTFEVTS